MTLERLLRAAHQSVVHGHHTPHCYSAHVPGQGYVNDGTILATRADYLRQLDQTIATEITNLGYASGYAEPGYTQPTRGVLFANWNVFPRGFDRVLEHAGYAVEWSDEWTTCDDCQGAVRTSPDSYCWTPSYVEVDGDLVCTTCAKEHDA